MVGLDGAVLLLGVALTHCECEGVDLLADVLVGQVGALVCQIEKEVEES